MAFLTRAPIARHEAPNSFWPTVSNFLEIHLVIHVSFLTEQSLGIITTLWMIPTQAV